MIVLAGFTACAAAGALLRWLAGAWLNAEMVPWGTLVTNVVGAFLLGLLHHVDSTGLVTVLGTGGLGTLTTFSTLSHEVIDHHHLRAGLAYLAGTLVLGITAAWAGIALAS